jgi:Flp pilus assembly protein TadD
MNRFSFLTLAVAIVAVVVVDRPGLAKTPLSNENTMSAFESQLSNLAKSSGKSSDSAEAEWRGYEQQAEESIKGGKYSEAVELCSKAIAANPEDLHAYRLRAMAYMRLGQKDKAKDDQIKLLELQEQIAAKNCKEEIAKYSAAINANPKNAQAYADRAAAYMNLNQYEQAVDDSSKAISLDAKNKYAYFTRMAAYTALHNNVKARSDRETFQSLDRGDKIRLSNSAVIDYSRIIESNPNDINALLNRARAYVELGQFPSARKDCDALIKLNVDTQEVKEIRSRCQKEIRRHSAKEEKSRK